MTRDPVWFEEGLALFNTGRFFECHEAWERAWKHAGGDTKEFYQGLIQAAAAILHVQRGNRAGAASLYEKARRKLERFPDDYMGLALGDLRRDLAAFVAAGLSPDASHPPQPPAIARADRSVR
jgi:predicted metal-dependent hydrolase